ncbi:MAG: hypothetical protein GOV15_02450, partial [Candidatus Diapherotrites archaeon]|nr:hypothetical protein [Candidatus Diapherotrites archaeon]
MNNKGASITVSVILGIVIVVGMVIILNGFGIGLVSSASEGATSTSTQMTDPNSSQSLQLEGVNLSAGDATVRYLNCDTNGTVDSIIVNDSRYMCDPEITVTCGANTISFSDCSITDAIQHTDIIKFSGPNLSTAVGGSASISGGTGGVSTWTPTNNPPVISLLATNCFAGNGFCSEPLSPTISGQADDGEGDSIPTDNCWYKVERQDNPGVWIPDWTAIDTATGYGTANVSWSAQSLYSDGVSTLYSAALHNAYVKCQDSEANESDGTDVV